RVEIEQLEDVAFVQRRQGLLILFVVRGGRVLFLVFTRSILEDGQEAGELLHFARSAEREVAHRNVRIGDVKQSRLHLRPDKSVPDHLVEAVLLARQEVLDLFGVELHRRRTDGLVRFLRLCSFFDLIYVRFIRKDIGTVFGGDIGYHFSEGIVADAHRVGTHVGDQSGESEGAKLFALIQLLFFLHCGLHRPLETVVGGALQRRGDERRRRGLFLFLPRDFADDVLAALERSLDLPRDFLVRNLGLLPVDLRQLRGKGRRRIRGELRGERPVFDRNERFDLFLAVDDHLHRHRLHAPRGEAAADFVPQQRRELVADEAVEHAPGLLRVDLVHIDLARILDGFPDGVLRDLVEEDAADLLRVAAEEVHDVPADRLALAIRVGGDENRGRLFRGRLQLADDLLFALEDLVGRLERLLVHAQLALRQIAHM